MEKALRAWLDAHGLFAITAAVLGVIATLSVIAVAFLTWRAVQTTPPTLADNRAERLTSTQVVEGSTTVTGSHSITCWSVPILGQVVRP